MTGKSIILLLLLAVSFSGCKPTGYLLYLIAPGSRMTTVDAEFEGLAGNSVAVVVFADPAILCDYPMVRLDLSTVLAAELKKHLKGVTVIDPRRVLKFQDANLYWDAIPKSQLAEQLGAKYMLFISLVEYSSREPGSTNLFRGRIVAETSVYQSSSPRSAPVWRGKEIRVAYPEAAPVGLMSDDDRNIRYRTEKLFADVLVKKFYKHKVPKE